jgi:hypothetical protein
MEESWTQDRIMQLLRCIVVRQSCVQGCTLVSWLWFGKILLCCMLQTSFMWEQDLDYSVMLQVLKICIVAMLGFQRRSWQGYKPVLLNALSM